MKARGFIAALAAAAVLLPLPALALWDMGESVRTARDMQILNPDAGKNTCPPVGLNGRYAVRSMQRYIGAATPAPQPSSGGLRLVLPGSMGRASPTTSGAETAGGPAQGPADTPAAGY